MSHLHNYTTNFQNLVYLIKTLKFIGVRNFNLEKEKREAVLFSIRLTLFDFNKFFSFCWDGYGYSLISETDLLFNFSKLKYSFSKAYNMGIVSQQTKRFAFQFFSFHKINKQDLLKINRYITN